MNVKKTKKILIRISVELLLAFAIAFTVAFVITKAGSPDADRAITEQLRVQTEENNKLREQIISLEWQHADDIKRIGELEGIRQELKATVGRMEELIKVRQDNDRGTEADLNELGELLQRDREALSRIRELLQDENSEDSDS